MLDIQNLRDKRNINLQRAGVKKVHLPLEILEKSGNYQNVLGEISLSVDLSKEFKGTHMSRFMEILNKWSKKRISSKEVKIILEEAMEKLNSNRSEISIDFRYFIEKTAPVSLIKGMMDYICHFHGLIEKDFTFVIGVDVPISTVCPCSKEISQYGAHNQRAIARVKIEYLPGEFIWLEDLISGIEETGSFGLFSIIKREDEKYITEQAYENPKFVEDVVRDITVKLRENKKLSWFQVECESAESIHNHNAFAYYEEKVKSEL